MRRAGRGSATTPIFSRAFAIAALLLFAAGCAPSGPAGNASTASPESYGTILEERYGGAFPDDRVLAVRILMDAADWQAMQKDITAKEYYKADIWIDGELVQDVAVRTKGSSSLMSAAKARSFRAGLKVDFNFFNSERSYHGLKKLVYNNGFSDPTLMREFLGYELMALMGVPTPRACFADLWVNGTHLGVYTQVEAVDSVFAEEAFGTGDGYLYKPEIRAGALDWTEADVVAEKSADAGSATTGGAEDGQMTISPGGLGAAPAGAGVFREYDVDLLTSAGLKNHEDSPDYSGLFELVEILNRDPDAVSAQDLEGVLHVDEVLRFLAASTVLVHLDNYIGMGHNYYLYDDDGRFWVVPWDLNMAFGGFSSGLNEEQILGFYIDEPTAASVDEYPLVQQLLDEPEYLDAYREYLRRAIEGPFSVDRMTARIHEIADLIRPYVEQDDNLAFSLEDFEQGLTQDLSSVGASGTVMGGSFIGLAYFVEERVASITAQLSGESLSGSGDGSGNGGSRGLGGLGGGGPWQGGGAQPTVPGGQPTRPNGPLPPGYAGAG